MEAVANGKLPQAMSEWLCASNLIAISKKDGGIRPIALGETLGKALLHTAELRHSFRACRPDNVGLAYHTHVRWWGWGSWQWPMHNPRRTGSSFKST